MQALPIFAKFSEGLISLLVAELFYEVYPEGEYIYYRGIWKWVVWYFEEGGVVL